MEIDYLWRYEFQQRGTPHIFALDPHRDLDDEQVHEHFTFSISDVEENESVQSTEENRSLESDDEEVLQTIPVSTTIFVTAAACIENNSIILIVIIVDIIYINF